MEAYLGVIFPMPYNFAPRGWAYCAGTKMPIAQNTALFSLLGTTYGGDGVTTFALPDLRGRTIVGQGQGAGLPGIVQGQVAGTNSATITQAQMAAHTHVITAKGNGLSSNSSDPNNSYFGGGTNIYDSDWDNSSVMNAQCITMGAVGNGIPIDIMNPYLGLAYNICTSGVFPSRN